MNIGPTIRAMRHNKVRVFLIILEIAVTLAIVTNCINMILVEREKLTHRSGFDDDNLISVQIDNFGKEFDDADYVRNTVNSDIRQLESIPGVVAASSTYFIPWAGGGSSGFVTKPGTLQKFQTQTYPGTADIVRTLGSRIADGRGFTAVDYAPVPKGAPARAYLISPALAKKMFGTVSPVGKVILGSDGKSELHVVGVLDEFYNPYPWPIDNDAIFSARQGGDYYLVRVAPGAMKAVSAAIEGRILSVNHNRVITLKSIPQIKEQFFQQSQLTVVAMSAVIVVLVFITVLGIVGITSLSVAERTRQIGTRRALGATRHDILAQFLTENWLVTTTGLIIGIALAYALNIALVTKVTDAKLDWRLLLAGMVVLWASGIGATLWPALRASSVSPAIATRSV